MADSTFSTLFFDGDGKNDHKSFELPGARRHYNPHRPGQVEHICLELELDFIHQRYDGVCGIRLNPIRNGITTLVLDAVDLTITAVHILYHHQDNPEAESIPIHQPFDYDGSQLSIHLTQPTIANHIINILITYGVEKPNRGLYFITPTPSYPHKPLQVWTQGEDEDSRYWFPCFDYPGQLATSEVKVRVPSNLSVISNGELIHTQSEGDTVIYHWFQSQVHPTYLMTVVVGDFGVVKDQWNGRPVDYYVEKGREGHARISFSKTPRMIEFFSTRFDYPYPFAKYAQICVDDFIFGGMENTSATILTDRCLLDERAILDNRSTEHLVAHELAHQWFGDLVVIRHWSHAWLKEGMASYAEVMWTEHEYGVDDAAYYRFNQARSYIAEDSGRYRRPIVTHIYREAIELYDRHLYEKGAWIYHMIRSELGDDLFWNGIATFVKNNAFQTVETVDLLRAVDQATGRNLLSLFDQYVYRGGHPSYKVTYSWDSTEHLAQLRIVQTQAREGENHKLGDLFDLPIPVAFAYIQDEATRTVELKQFKVRIHERDQTLYFPLTDKPDFLCFDVGNHYLKTVALEYPMGELKAQLQFDPDPIARIFAAEALAKKGGLEAVKALHQGIKHDSVWGVRIELIKQLATIQLDQVSDLLIESLSDSDPRVRRAAVEGLTHCKTVASGNALMTLLEKGDPSYYVEAAAAQGVGTMAGVGGSLSTEVVIPLLHHVLRHRSGWNEVVRSGAIRGLSRMNTSESALSVVLSYTDIGIPQSLRLSAIRALGSLSVGQTPVQLERILNRLEQLTRESFYLTQVAVIGALGQMETPKAISILQTLVAHTSDGRIRRIGEEAIQSVQKGMGSDKAIKQLREELEQLKKDNQGLRSRLAALEVKSEP